MSCATKCKYLIVILLAFFGLHCSAPKSNISASTASNKNILFIAVDDLKPLTGAYGYDFMITPHLDKLANDGVLFMNNHTQQAVCGPSRASIMTGKRPDYTKVFDLKTQMRNINPDILTMPQYFKNKGYQSVAVGKIYDPRCVDKDYDAISWSLPYQSPKGQEYANSKGKPAFEINDRHENETIDGGIATNSIEYLQKFAKEKSPFFLAVGFKKPHLPFVAPKKYWDLYPETTIKFPNFRNYPENAPTYAPQPSWELRSGYDGIPKDFDTPIPDETQLKLIRGYYAAVSFIDAQIGRVIDELDRLGIRENTIIVLWGDHGFHLGDHSMFCKHTNYEQSTRSPLIISYPNNKKGKINTPTEFVDIFPTLCDLTGIDIPKSLDGKSLVPLMEKKVNKVKDFAVSQFPRDNDKMGYAFRNETYRYIVWMKDFTSAVKYDEKLLVAEELYDYSKDPEERKNLVQLTEYKDVRAKMKKEMIAFFNQCRQVYAPL